MRVVGDVLRLNAKRYPEKNALIMEDRHLSYRRLNQRVNQLAHGFLSLGIKKGDRVAILGHNTLEWVIAAYAAAKCGVVTVPINFRYQTDELIYVINSAMPDLLVTGAECVPLVQDALPAFSRPVKMVAMSPESLASGTTCEALM
ncbi:MAG: AMP-binding protein, partial [Deltaproteobacteria bacterium]|nr:AMP-binding protein [Deltaproteobacteria bacterium]